MVAPTDGVIKKRCYEDDETGGQNQKAKKRRKIEKNDIQSKHQKIKLSSEVKTPSLSTQMFGEGQISYEQLCEFLKYATQGNHHNVTQPSWCRIHHQRHLAGVMVVILHDVDQLHFYRYYLQFKHLRKTFKYRFSLPALSGDFIKKLGGLGKDDSQKLSREVLERDEVPIIQKHTEKVCRLSSYILTPEEMRVYDYPIEGCADRSHFVHTLCNGPVTDSSPLFGLDCEMCLTDKGSELTRIALVDSHGQCIMNELVKPKRPVRNYLTCYSGITEKLLGPVQTTLVEIQSQLKSILPPDAVLVGHSLDADLRALEMIHPNVIDTSLLYVRKGGKRFKLKFLAAAVLGKEIQSMGQLGHDPTEDAQSALELAQYFIEHGRRKVAELNLEARLSEQRKMGETETKVKVEQNERMEKVVPNSSLLDNFNEKTLLLGGPDDVQKHTASSNEQILQKALEEIPKSPVNIIQLALGSKHVTADLLAEATSKMRAKLLDLLTIYVGPLSKDVGLKTLEKAFGKCGHIQTIQVISETLKPHLSIQYEVLEGAQLALEDLNGAEIGGSVLKVQRPITEMTLEVEMLLRELEKDPENEATLYLAGLRKCQEETELREQLGPLEGLQSIFWPRNLQTGRQKNYCFLRFQSPECTCKALPILQGNKSFRKSRRALTSPTFFQWAGLGKEKGQGGAETPHKQQRRQQPLDQELGLKKAIKKLDRHVKTLYEQVPENTLCLVLLPGAKRFSDSLSGLSLVGVKGKKSISTSC